MYQAIEQVNGQPSQPYVEALENFYQRLNDIPNTIISLQYDTETFLTFKVNEAIRGSIVRQGFANTNIALQCQIRGNTYIFTREHLEQLSNRECRDLLNQLGFSEFLSLFI